MDFETPKVAPTSQDVTDEARSLASAKKVVLTPLHDDVEPENIDDTSMSVKHQAEDTIANVPSDTESTYVVPEGPIAMVKPLTASNRSKSIMITASIAVVLITSVIFYIVTQ